MIRALLRKDLLLLRRAPLVTGLLVIYPIALALLIGFALSREPSDPRVAFANLVPVEANVLVAGAQLDRGAARDEFCSRVDCIEVDSRAEAEDLVRSGDVLGALVLPAAFADQINSLRSLDPQQPIVDVLVNVEDPVKGQIVDDRISALLNQANLRISRDINDQAIDYIATLVHGGSIDLFGTSIKVLGLDASERSLARLSQTLPAAQKKAVGLAAVLHFTRLARANLDVADDLLGAVSSPITVDKRIVSGDAPTLDHYAISVAAAVTLMFVTVLLVAGALALEREENAFVRLTRGGLVARGRLLAEKLILGVIVAVLVTTLMLVAVETFVNLRWERAGLIAIAVVAAGAGFAAFGAAIGTLAAEVRGASLLAFMVSLPIALVSLIPSGTVGATAFDVIGVVAASFPFDPALDALSGALDPAGPSVGVAAAHLLVLSLVYGGIARISLNRLAD